MSLHDHVRTFAAKSVQVLVPLTVNMQAMGTCSKDHHKSGRDRELSGTRHARSRTGPEAREWLTALETVTQTPAGRTKRCDSF